jgi:enoyl-CoA hydratase/carnithine racemase
MEVTTMEGAVFYERRGQIGYIILNRSHVLNAMNDEWIVALLKAAEAARADLAARVVVVRGAGRAFCAGADLKAIPRHQELLDHWQTHIGPEQEIARVFRRMGRPIIAQVHGYAVGGGCEVAMLADVRIAAEGTKFGFTEVEVGATVTMGGLYNLTRIVGVDRAFELLYSRELIDVVEAMRIGLVNRVVPAEKLEEWVREFAEKIASHYPAELALTREGVYRAMDQDFDASVEMELQSAMISHLGGARDEGMARQAARIHQRKNQD